MKNGEQPVFPTPDFNNQCGVVQQVGVYGGLTKREYFAALAMQGIMARAGDWNSVKDFGFVSRQVLIVADNLLEKLEASNGGRSLPEVLQSEEKLKAAAKKWISAYDQVDFFSNGYKNGSASIAEVDHAKQEEYKAYSQMFDLINKP